MAGARQHIGHRAERAEPLRAARADPAREGVVGLPVVDDLHGDTGETGRLRDDSSLVCCRRCRRAHYDLVERSETKQVLLGAQSGEVASGNGGVAARDGGEAALGRRVPELKKGPEGEPRAQLRFLAVGTGYFLLVVRFRTVRRVRLAAGVAFFAALRRRRFFAGAFLALDFFVALRRFFAGERFFAALRFLAGAFFAARFFVARFFVARFLVAFLAVVFRFAVDFRFAGAFRFAALRFAGAFLAARRFVAFFAGGTVTTFLGELSLGEVRTSSHSVRGGATHALRHQELFTSFFSSDPTVNFTLFDAAI